MLEARRLLERTLGLDPNYAPAMALLGTSYLLEDIWCWKLDRSNRKRAVEFLHSALALDPRLSDAHLGLGLAEAQRSRHAEAILHFERAIELAPSGDGARIGLSAEQSRSGHPLAGLRTLQSVLRRTSRPNSSVLSALMFAQWRAGRLEDALRTAESVRETYPEQLPVLLWLADQYEATGRHDEAKAVVTEVLAVNPELRADKLGECLVSESPAELHVLQANLRRAGLP
jgi:tetratricopeptide (TPR) repeat protein